MAKVKVRTFSVIRDVLGADLVEIEVGAPETVGGLFSALVQKYGERFKNLIWDSDTGQMDPFLLVLNGAMIRSTVDMDKKITDGDEIAIIFPVGGG